MTLAAVALAVFTLTRLGLAVFTGLDLVPLSYWPGIFLKGLWFDAAALSAIVAPKLLFDSLLPSSWRAHRLHGRARLAALWASAFLLIFCAAAEATFWLEFSTRFNFIAVDYLIYTTEVLGNIWESYPIVWIVLGVAAAAGAVAWTARRGLDQKPLAPRQRLARGALAFVLPGACLAAVDVDFMRGSGNAYADELAGNGLVTFAAAFRRNELDYDRFYRTLPQGRADETLARLGVPRPPLSGAGPRPRPAADDFSAFMRRPRHVVLVSVESLSANYLGAYGARHGITPELDALAKAGLKFERAFATGTRTVRGLEALSLGTPPVPGQSIVRRPGNGDLATVGGLLKRRGVTPFFIYGGFGYFDNMNAYFRANGYAVLDRTDFPKQSVVFENVWGVADESLYANALAALDREAAAGRRFFAHVLTTSNHRPFTYPGGRIDIPSPGGRHGAVKYTDWAIGRLIAEARSRPWFKDALFVIVADHCASVAGRTSLPVHNYRIPLILYGPDLVKPGVDRRLVSQIDLMPTLLSLMGAEGEELFFGRGLFKRGAWLDRAFVSNYQELGYLRRGILTVLLPKGRVESFRVDPETMASTPAPVDESLLEEAIAYYQTASRAFRDGALKLPAD